VEVNMGEEGEENREEEGEEDMDIVP